MENINFSKVVPRISTSYCHVANKGAIDWGWHGMLAYASQCNVVVIDSENAQPVQCLVKHKYPIKKVLWSPYREGERLSNLYLVSADSNGYLVLWNVGDASVVSYVQEGSKPVVAIDWLPTINMSNPLYLVALHSPYNVVLWNIELGEKTWKLSFTDVLNGFSFDPFDSCKVAFLCQDCILFVDDFSATKKPSTNGKRFYISSPRLNEENMRARDRLKKLMRGLVVGENKPRPEDAMTISECLQMTYHKSLRNHVLLLYARDIVLIDLHINMTVGVISVDKTASPLMQITSCSQRDVLYCLHESGSVSVRVRRKNNSNLSMASPFDTPLDSLNKLDTLTISPSEKFVWYDFRCQSEPIRQVKGMKILSIAVCPTKEKEIALILNAGKVVFIELEKMDYMNTKKNKQNILSDIFPSSTTDKVNPTTNVRMVTHKISSNLSRPITVIRMCPLDSARSILSTFSENINYLAIGTQTGHILFYNVLTGIVCKEFYVHSNLIRGIEWCGFTSVLSWAQSDSGVHKVRNEIYLTSVVTGQYRQLRTNMGPESPIEFIRVSPMKEYFVIVKKDGKMELWNMKKLSFIRSMPDKFPIVKTLEWSPVQTKSKRKMNTYLDPHTSRRRSSDATSEPASEHFLFCDADCMLYCFAVNNNAVKNGIKIPPEHLVAPVTSLAMKGNKIVKADIEGQLNIWDLKDRVSKVVNTNRTCIAKIRFSPGPDFKLLILYVDGGVDVTDLDENISERISQLKCPKDIAKIIDIDWAGPKLPVLVTDDGSIIITDISLTRYSSSIDAYTFRDPVKCSALLKNEHVSLIHQWISLQGEVQEIYNSLNEVAKIDSGTRTLLEALPIDELNECEFGVAERSLMLSIFLGLLDEIKFWTVVLYYLQATEINGTRDENEFEDNGNKFGNRYFAIEPLDVSYDLLCDRYTFQKTQLEQVELYEWKRGDYNHSKRVIERLILLGETDRAVQLLLETDLTNSNYYSDSIKACLLAAIQTGTDSAQSTIKLVATNFIANGRILEGVELLCLIGKGADACRYLISNGLYHDAMWLAKATLPFEESSDIFKRCLMDAKNRGNMISSVLMSVSQFDWNAAIQQLVQSGSHGKAMLLLKSCKSFKIPIDDELSKTTEHNFAKILETFKLPPVATEQ